MKILFVCTGNICRSPTAEGVFRHHLQQAGLDTRVQVDSAGTHSYHVGQAPDTRSQATALARGCDISQQVSRKVQHADFYEYDIILGMDRGHVDDLQVLQPPDSRSVVALFLPFSGVDHTADVPDPYYDGEGAFEHVYNLVDEASALLLNKVQQAV